MNFKKKIQYTINLMELFGHAAPGAASWRVGVEAASELIILQGVSAAACIAFAVRSKKEME
jgi:hypothetical protein